MEWLNTTMVLGVLIAVGAGLLIAWGVRRLEADQRREEEATRLQERIAESLSRDPRLRAASMLPVVSVPRRGPVVVELTGEVQSPRLRDLVIDTARHEVARACGTGRRARAFTVVNRLEVAARRSA
ncbi:MAG TPA: hypothetical protein VMR23_06820 [Candidatus Limnocylindria bacterium]|nr:hypothetical protein [Candidatus Limnocylindria bacterium]